MRHFLCYFGCGAAVKTTQTARPLKRRIKGDEISSELIKKVKRYIHNSGRHLAREINSRAVSLTLVWIAATAAMGENKMQFIFIVAAGRKMNTKSQPNQSRPPFLKEKIFTHKKSLEAAKFCLPSGAKTKRQKACSVHPSARRLRSPLLQSVFFGLNGLWKRRYLRRGVRRLSGSGTLGWW